MEEISKDNNAIVYFSAEWCGPCKQLKPHFAKAAVKDNKTDYFVIDIDKIDNKYLEEYSIKGVPAVFVMKNGIIIIMEKIGIASVQKEKNSLL